MTLRALVSGWLLGPPSGANRRLLALLGSIGPRLQRDERVTVLHRPDYVPPPVPGIAWEPIDIPAGPAWRRARAEGRLLDSRLRVRGASLLDHGFLPLPSTPVPTCLVVHDLRIVDGFSRWPRAVGRAVLRHACRRAAAVVAPSEWTAARLAALVPGLRPVVVPNAVAPPLPPTAPLPLAPPANGYLLHVGHVETRKNLGLVVDALHTLPPDARPELWLAGRDAGALASLQERAGDLPLRVLGAVDEPTLASLYGAARAVVLPSAHEGFGLPALEGLAHGRPVLVADAGALPEVVGAAGVVLPVDDAAAWAAAIAATVDVGDATPRRARAATFSWDDAAARLLACWRRIGTTGDGIVVGR